MPHYETHSAYTNITNSEVENVSAIRNNRRLIGKQNKGLDYPYIIPYNGILVPNSLYEDNKDAKPSITGQTNYATTFKVTKPSKSRKYLKRKHRQRNRQKLRTPKGTRSKSKRKRKRTHKTKPNPVISIFRRIYYKYFSRQDRQLVGLGSLASQNLPVSSMYGHIFS